MNRPTNQLLHRVAARWPHVNTQRKWNEFNHTLLRTHLGNGINLTTILREKKVCLKKKNTQKNNLFRKKYTKHTSLSGEKGLSVLRKRPDKKAFAWSRLTHDDAMILRARRAKMEAAASESPRPLKGNKLLRR